MLIALVVLLTATNGRVVETTGPASVRVYPYVPQAFGCTDSTCGCPDRIGAFAAAVEKAALVAPPEPVTTADDGTFTLPDPSSEAFIEAVSIDGKRFGGAVWKPGQTQPLELRLSSDRQVDLDVTATAPVEPSTLRLFIVDVPIGRAVQLTRSKNRFSGPVTTPHAVLLALADGLPAQTRDLIMGRLVGFDAINRRTPSLALAPIAPITGTVSAAGKPVAKARVTAAPQICATTTTTDDSGAFRLDGVLPAPGNTELEARANGLLGWAMAVTGKSVNVALTKPIAVVVQLSDARKKPVARVPVSVQIDYGQNGSRWVNVTTDAAGKAPLELAGPAKISLRLKQPEWAFTSRLSAEVKGPRPAVERFELVPTSKVNVTVVDGDGKPVPQTRVEVFYGEALQPKLSLDFKAGLRDRASVTGTDGVAVLDLAPGSYEVAVNDHRFGRASGLVNAPGDLTLKLGGAAVAGIVTSPDGKPLARVSVNLGADNQSRGTVTGADGSFRIAASPGTWKLSAGPLSSRAPAQTVEVVADQTTKVTLVVAPPGKVRGTVVDDKGNPVEGAEVFSFDGYDTRASMAVTQPALMASLEQLATARARSGQIEPVRTAADGSFEVEGDSLWLIARFGTLRLEKPVRATAGTPVKLSFRAAEK